MERAEGERMGERVPPELRPQQGEDPTRHDGRHHDRGLKPTQAKERVGEALQSGTRRLPPPDHHRRQHGAKAEPREDERLGEEVRERMGGAGQDLERRRNDQRHARSSSGRVASLRWFLTATIPLTPGGFENLQNDR